MAETQPTISSGQDPKPQFSAVLAHGLKLVVFSAGFLFIGANLAFAAYYSDRVYPGVSVSGITLSGKSREEARRALDDKADSYSLVLAVGPKRYHFKPQDYGASYNVAATLDAAWVQGRGHGVPLMALLDKPRTLRFAHSLDQPTFNRIVSDIATSNSAEPINAAVVVDNGQPKIVPERSGRGIDSATLAKTIQEATEAQEAVINLPDTTLIAKVRSADLGPSVEAAKQIIASQIDFTYQGKHFAPTPSQIGSWIGFAPDDQLKLKPQPDHDRVAAYVHDGLAGPVYVAPKNKLINVVNGSTTGVEEGVVGKSLNEAPVVAALMQALSGNRQLSLELTTTDLPFKTVYNRTINLDAGRYIEINLNSQHLWAYQDHKVAYESAITTGAVDYGFGTPAGLFSIYDKGTNRYLDGRSLGYNYRVYVQYWMPFNGDIGLHDASWRYDMGGFGGQDYRYQGSHGCVNLPTETAAWLYGWADVGTPVWVHY